MIRDGLKGKYTVSLAKSLLLWSIFIGVVVGATAKTSPVFALLLSVILIPLAFSYEVINKISDMLDEASKEEVVT